MDRPRYWSARGEVHTRARIMTEAEAEALVDLYFTEATAAHVAGDGDVWAVAARLGLELNAALRSAQRYRLAGQAAPSSTTGGASHA